MRTSVVVIATAVALGSAALFLPARAQQQGGGMNAGDFGQRLVEGLQQIEGCVGVEAAMISGGKATIIAWFEDKAAAKRWYYSDMHRGVMMMAGGDMAREPMTHVADDIPIMVMATITPARQGQDPLPGVPMPISQISIEMYTPLPGGAMFNGRLTPMEIDIPHMRGTEMPEAAGDAAGA
ncbi:MAG: hypothetical protein AAGG07_06450 [Planctomycetota bacterium]